ASMVVLPASIWSLAVIYSHYRPVFDRPIEGQGAAGLYYLWSIFVCPILLWVIGVGIWSKGRTPIDLVMLASLTISWLVSAWSALLEGASIGPCRGALFRGRRIVPTMPALPTHATTGITPPGSSPRPSARC